MKKLSILAVLALVVILPGCSLIPMPTPPAAVPDFYLPTDLPTGTPTPLPTATPTPTPTATTVPVLPDRAGQIYVTLAERPENAKFTLRLVRLPAGCVDCPQPVDIPGFINPTGDPNPLVWSPDGKTAAQIVPAFDTSPASVRLYNPSDESWKTAAEFDDILSGPYWSPDSQLLAVYAVKGGKADYYTLTPDGSKVTNISKGVISTYKKVLPAGWLNGELAFSALTTKGIKAHAIAVQYPRVHIISNIPVFTGEDTPIPLLPSPDGKWVAYTEVTPRVGQMLGLLRVHDTEVSHPLMSSKDGRITALAWAPDGGWLAYALQTGGATEVDLVRPDGSELHPVYLTQQGVRAISFDPGGSGWLLVETAGRDTAPAEPSRLVLVNGASGEHHPVNAPVSEGTFWEGASWQPAQP